MTESNTLSDQVFVDPEDPFDREQVLAEFRTRKRLGAARWFIVAGLFALFLAGGLWARHAINTRADHLEDKNATLSHDVRANDTKITDLQSTTSKLVQDSLALRKELVKKGVNPNTIAPPPETRLVAGPAGVNGRGLSGASVSGSSLILFYSDGTSQVVGNVRGPAGVGLRGAVVSGGDLILSFTDGSTTNLGTVTGPVGATGPPGPQGIQGLPGVQGDVGPKGDPGRGISSAECVGDGTDSHWVIHYSEGNDTTADGPCKISLILP